MWGSPPTRSARHVSVQAGSRYAHFVFPDPVAAGVASAAVHRAVTALPGWRASTAGSATEASAEVTGYQAFVHPDTGVELLAVVAGFQPLVLSVGQRSEDLRVSSSAGFQEVARSGTALRGQLATLARALKAVERSARELGGRTAGDAELLGLVRQAQERFEWWVAAEHRAEQLAPCLSHRSCPVCQSWSSFEARWCRSCRHEFTPQENFGRDAAKAGAERELAALRMEGMRASEGGPPPPPTHARVGPDVPGQRSDRWP
jgi:hypothetical protein